MSFQFVEAIQNTIKECVECGHSRTKIKDDNGENKFWIEAEWVEHWNGTHDVVLLEICYTDTGNVAYSCYIEETMTEKC